jgi:hypothetical protein
MISHNQAELIDSKILSKQIERELLVNTPKQKRKNEKEEKGVRFMCKHLLSSLQ